MRVSLVLSRLCLASLRLLGQVVIIFIFIFIFVVVVVVVVVEDLYTFNCSPIELHQHCFVFKMKTNPIETNETSFIRHIYWLTEEKKKTNNHSEIYLMSSKFHLYVRLIWLEMRKENGTRLWSSFVFHSHSKKNISLDTVRAYLYLCVCLCACRPFAFRLFLSPFFSDCACRHPHSSCLRGTKAAAANEFSKDFSMALHHWGKEKRSQSRRKKKKKTFINDVLWFENRTDRFFYIFLDELPLGHRRHRQRRWGRRRWRNFWQPKRWIVLLSFIAIFAINTHYHTIEYFVDAFALFFLFFSFSLTITDVAFTSLTTTTTSMTNQMSHILPVQFFVSVTSKKKRKKGKKSVRLIEEEENEWRIPQLGQVDQQKYEERERDKWRQMKKKSSMHIHCVHVSLLSVSLFWFCLVDESVCIRLMLRWLMSLLQFFSLPSSFLISCSSLFLATSTLIHTFSFSVFLSFFFSRASHFFLPQIF